VDLPHENTKSDAIAPPCCVAVLGSGAGDLRRHKSRDLFGTSKSSTPSATRSRWTGRLQLEQSYWSSHAFVERVANTKLQMNLPQTGTCGSSGRETRFSTKRGSGESESRAKSYRCARTSCWGWWPRARSAS